MKLEDRQCKWLARPFGRGEQLAEAGCQEGRAKHRSREKCIYQNVFLNMYLSKCISQNVFLKMAEGSS